MNRMQTFLSFLMLLPIVSLGQNYTIEYGENLKYSRINPEAIDNIRTIELWFKLENDYTPTSLSPQAFIQREDQTGPDLNEFGIGLVDFIGRKGHLEFHFNGNKIQSDQNYWRADNWYHVAGVIDSNEGMKLYIHGVEQFDSDPYNVAIYSTTDTTFVGTWGFKRYRYFDGSIDEIRFWNRALSQEEIVENMCRGLDTNQVDGLVTYYKFEQGSGDTAYDYSTNDYHILVNNVAWEDDNTCYVSGNMNSELSKGGFNVKVGIEKLVLDFNYSDNSEIDFIRIYDITGRQLFQRFNIKGNSHLAIPTSNFPSGPVLINAGKDGHLITQKVVIW